MKKTPWFGYRKRPHRVGVYETNWFGSPGWFAHWDGVRWGPAESTPLKAWSMRNEVAAQHKGWRGLATKDGK